MKIKLEDREIPYPLTTIKGKLRLSGVTDATIASMLTSLKKNSSSEQTTLTEQELLQAIREMIDQESQDIVERYDILTTYDQLRGIHDDIPPLIVVLEGASATGKSMLALDIISALSTTRIISTDSIRQIIRAIYSQEEYPELYCHTYQAHKYKQSGSTELQPIIRGFLAQLDLLSPHIENLTKRILSEGAIGIIEGVHILPGTLQKLDAGVLELLINPSEEIHRAMFVSKKSGGKLKSVSDDSNVRMEEFQSTRMIQEYMIGHAKEHEISIINLKSYNESFETISKLIIERLRLLIRDYR
jgi:2-phosphoglycerate kinase